LARLDPRAAKIARRDVHQSCQLAIGNDAPAILDRRMVGAIAHMLDQDLRDVHGVMSDVCRLKGGTAIEARQTLDQQVAANG
jgi:hypothetical protein